MGHDKCTRVRRRWAAERRDLWPTMFFEPPVTDESQPRCPGVFKPPCNPFREGGEDSDGDDDPESFHRQVSSFFILGTTRRHSVSRATTMNRFGAGPT